MRTPNNYSLLLIKTNNRFEEGQSVHEAGSRPDQNQVRIELRLYMSVIIVSSNRKRTLKIHAGDIFTKNCENNLSWPIPC